MSSLFSVCKLSGDDLINACNELLDCHFTASDAQIARLIQTNHIYVEPPHKVHVNRGYDKKLRRCDGEWQDIPLWRATVSASIRQWKNQHGYDCVGRGEGPDMYMAVMRAFVHSHLGFLARSGTL